MKPESNRALIFEMADGLLRSWWTVVAGISVGLAGALLVLDRTPKIFQASAKILISPQRISEEFFETTVTEDMTRRMMALEQAVISDKYMTQLIERTYGPQDNANMQALTRSVRNRVSMRPTNDIKLGWLAFELTFRDGEPDRAAKVVNTLAELYIDQNTEFRTRQAKDVTDTIEERLTDAKAEFEDVDRRLNEFNAKHSTETEQHLDTNLRLLDSGTRDLESNLAKQTLLQERLTDLITEIDKFSEMDSTRRAIAKLETELESLLTNYSDAHPAVVRKRRQLEELKLTAKDPDVNRVAIADPALTKLQGQRKNTEAELSSLKTREGQIRRQVREYERRIQRVSVMQPQYTALLNEHRVLRERYSDLQEKADKAREAQFLEENEKGARLELAERAEVPISPVFPKPERFYPVGIVAGLIVFVGPLMVRRMLNPPISSEAGLRSLSDYPVLVSIPRVATPANKRYALKRFAKNFGLAAIASGALFAAIVFIQG